MKKITGSALLIAVSTLFFSTQVFAANVELEWADSSSYTDLRTMNMRQEAFESMVFRELGEQFQTSANKFLSEDQTLSITVTDLDLAGRVGYDYSINQRQRILKGYEFPAMSFSYEVKDENNRTVSSGEESIKALNLRSVHKKRYVGNELHRERSLINEWFVETF